MSRFLLVLLLTATCAHAQERTPTPDEVAFARLPQDLQAMLGTVQNVLAQGYSAVQSASAGASSFPPLSPLVPAIEFRAR